MVLLKRLLQAITRGHTTVKGQKPFKKLQLNASMVCCLGTLQLNEKSVATVWNYQEVADKAFMLNKIENLHVSHKENKRDIKFTFYNLSLCLFVYFWKFLPSVCYLQ